MKHPVPKRKPVERSDYHNPALHRAILELYARYTDHKYACPVHAQARKALAQTGLFA